MLAEGEMLTDNLMLKRELGSGAMGTVWMALNCALDAPVAVKVLRTEGMRSEVVRSRFEQEARGLARLNDPHIVRVFDYGLSLDNQPFIVMELMRGEDLASRLKRAERMDQTEVSLLIRQCARALGHAHAAGIVHRDLKPANIFLIEGDETFVKILDFGVARFVDRGDRVTKAGTLVGTPLFMSPEQFTNNLNVDHRSDLWALAVVAYRCLTGVVPFPGETVATVGMLVTGGRFDPPSKHRPELGAALDEVMVRALQLEREKRFQSAKELAEAFTRALGGKAQVSNPPPAMASSAAAEAMPATQRLKRELPATAQFATPAAKTRPPPVATVRLEHPLAAAAPPGAATAPMATPAALNAATPMPQGTGTIALDKPLGQVPSQGAPNATSSSGTTAAVQPPKSGPTPVVVASGSEVGPIVSRQPAAVRKPRTLILVAVGAVLLAVAVATGLWFLIFNKQKDGVSTTKSAGASAKPVESPLSREDYFKDASGFGEELEKKLECSPCKVAEVSMTPTSVRVLRIDPTNPKKMILLEINRSKGETGFQLDTPSDIEEFDVKADVPWAEVPRILAQGLAAARTKDGTPDLLKWYGAGAKTQEVRVRSKAVAGSASELVKVSR